MLRCKAAPQQASTGPLVQSTTAPSSAACGMQLHRTTPAQLCERQQRLASFSSGGCLVALMPWRRSRDSSAMPLRGTRNGKRTYSSFHLQLWRHCLIDHRQAWAHFLSLHAEQCSLLLKAAAHLRMRAASSGDSTGRPLPGLASWRMGTADSLCSEKRCGLGRPPPRIGILQLQACPLLRCIGCAP